MTDTARSRWQARYDKARVREIDFTTLSGLELESAYGTDDSEWPGEFPFTRGLYPTGYRGRSWTIRQFAGFGNAQQTTACGRPASHAARARSPLEAWTTW